MTRIFIIIANQTMRLITNDKKKGSKGKLISKRDFTM
jgi:hypothetical protein